MGAAAGSLAEIAARLRSRRAARGSETTEEWVCAVCGYRGDEQRAHRLAGIHRCPSKKWRREPVRRREVGPEELVDRRMSVEHEEALAHADADEARRGAADGVDGMRRALRALRRKWRDALQAEAMVRFDLDRAEQHGAEEQRARSAIAAAGELVREGLREVENGVREAGLVDEAKAILAWNASPRAWRREARARVGGRVELKLGAAIGAKLLDTARSFAAQAEAEPTEVLRSEAAILVRELTGVGEQAGRWERSAARANERREREAPLLMHAGLVARVTPEERREGRRRAVVAGIAASAASEEATEQRASAYRAQVAAAVSAAEMAELEAHRAVLPDATVYSADFWHGEARRRGLVAERSG